MLFYKKEGTNTGSNPDRNSNFRSPSPPGHSLEIVLNNLVSSYKIGGHCMADWWGVALMPGSAPKPLEQRTGNRGGAGGLPQDPKGPKMAILSF